MTHPMFDPERRCTGLQDWPTPDQVAWRRALEPFDPFSTTTGAANRWAQSTQLKIANGYGRWLGWLENSKALDPQSTPGERATRERVSAYLNMLQKVPYAPYTVSGRLQDLGNALRVMEPQSDWSWILKAAGRLHGQARPAKDLQDRMRSADEVRQLGLDLMDKAGADRFRTAHDRAVMYRDGLAIAVLIHRPLRITNFASIRIGQHLRNYGDHWRLMFTAEDIKNKRPLEYPWPVMLEPQLERYLAVHRPILLDIQRVGREQSALWISKGGSAMTNTVLAYRIIKRTEDEFGTPINPHTFRHIAATTLATHDPENITGVPAVLGHASLETSEDHYNKAKGLNAIRRYQTTVSTRRCLRHRRTAASQPELTF